MLNKIAIAAVALVTLTSAAHADGYYYNHGGRGGNWVAPLIGGMIIGGAIASMNRPAYNDQVIIEDDQQYVPVCRNVFVGRDYWGRPVIRRICQ
jgi:hypothetical protein